MCAAKYMRTMRHNAVVTETVVTETVASEAVVTETVVTEAVASEAVVTEAVASETAAINEKGRLCGRHSAKAPFSLKREKFMKKQSFSMLRGS